MSKVWFTVHIDEELVDDLAEYILEHYGSVEESDMFIDDEDPTGADDSVLSRDRATTSGTQQLGTTTTCSTGPGKEPLSHPQT